MKQQKIVDITDDLFLLLNIFPVRIKKYLQTHSRLNQLNEVILDLGYKPEVRFLDSEYKVTNLSDVTQEEINSVIKKLGHFNTDNRAGIERTLHRISAIRNRTGKIIGLTCRVGRAVVGTIEIIRDIVESKKNILFLGPPGSGKTTKLRETARVLSDDLKKRVIVVDTSNEIAGDGDIPHPGIGSARRMQVPSPDRQHATMIEAVENHMPQVIIVDEIGTEEEAHAARTIAERGVQLVATAHGNSIENIIKNPTLSDLIGGVQAVILGDEEAKFRGTQKTVLERKTLPTFDCLIEIKELDVFAVYKDLKEVVDKFLKKEELNPQIRQRKADGTISIIDNNDIKKEIKTADSTESAKGRGEKPIKIFLFAINRDYVESVIKMLNLSLEIINNINDADFILTIKSQIRSNSKFAKLTEGRRIPVHVIKQNSQKQISNFFKYFFKLSETAEDLENEAISEIRCICEEVIRTRKTLDASSRNEYLRKIQHEEVEKYNLNSMSVGEDETKRVRVYPR